MKRALRCKQLFKAAAFLILSCILSAGFTSCPNSTGGNNQPGKSQVKITVKGDNNVTVKTSEFKVDKGAKWETVKKHTAITGITFKGNFKLSAWKLNNSTGSALTDSYVFNADTTVFAVSKNGSTPSEEVTITVQGDDNVESGKGTSFKVNKGTKWQTVKTKTEITGITFKSGFELSEWKLNNAAGSTLTDDYTFNANTTVFAVSAQKVTVTINGDDKVISGKGMFKVDKGSTWETVKEMPEIKAVACEGNFTVGAWKLNDDSGDDLDDDYTFNTDVTIFAVSGPIFTINEGTGMITGYSCSENELPETLVIPAELNSIQIKGIDENAFAEVNRIKILDMENCTDLTEIREKAFAKCTNLAEIKFPASLIEIKGDVFSAGAFSDCTSLKVLDFSKCTKLTKIAGFNKCSGITAITFPASLTEIGKEAFYKCEGLTGVLDLSKTALTKIDSAAFEDCAKITSIQFPASLTEIAGAPRASFGGCKGLTGVLDLSKCTKLTKVAGFGTTGITGIELPADVTEISQNAFSNCKGLTGTVDLTKYTKLTKISGFSACENITAVKLPASVTVIDVRAFSRCSKLAGELDLSACTALEAINEDAFQYAPITSVKFPKGTSLKKIHKAFLGCTELTGTLDFSKCTGLTEIGEMAFSNCPKVTAIQLPNTITKIEKKAFSGSGITTLDLSSCTMLEYIGVESFADCKALTSVVLPDNLMELKSDGYAGSFYGCTKAEITLKAGIKTIGKAAFGAADANFVKSVKVPNDSIKTLVKNSGYPENRITVGS